MRMELAPGVMLWPGRLGPAEQRALLAEVQKRTEGAPFYRPVMPGSGTPFSIEMRISGYEYSLPDSWQT